MRKNSNVSMHRRPTTRTAAVQSEELSVKDLSEHLKHYAQANPGTCALWCFIIGFITGWRLKPW